MEGAETKTALYDKHVQLGAKPENRPDLGIEHVAGEFIFGGFAAQPAARLVVRIQ